MLCIDYVCLVTSLRISNLVGGSATLSMLGKDVEIMLCNLVFIGDLHVIHLHGFGMILGMDWLNKYEAHILFSE